MPDLNDLDHFDEGIPVTPLPASEVRRRGDRMRRRNTVLATVGGVVAAAVFIGTPVAVLANQDGTDGVQVANPSTTSGGPSEGVAWVQEVPEDFPLAHGMPKENGDGSLVVPGEEWSVGATFCGDSTGWPPEPAVDHLGAYYSDGSENTEIRSIYLFADEAAASGALDLTESEFEACRKENLGEDLTLVRSEVDVELGTEESLAYATQFEDGDGTISGLEVLQVARTGNAVFVTSSYGSAGGDAVIAYEVNRLREKSELPLDLMCVFAEEPCEVTGLGTDGPTSEPPSPGPPSETLADFPLDQGYPETNEDGSPVEVTAEPGVGMIELCDSIAWDPYGGTTDLIGVEFGGPEDFRGRTLAIFRTEAQAVAALDNAADALAACPEEASDDESGASSVYEAFDVDLGYDTVVWTQRYRTPEGRFDTGLTVYQVARVGEAIYVSFEYGEAGGSEDSIRLAVLAATAAAEPIVEAMRAL